MDQKERQNAPAEIGFNTVISGRNWRQLPGIVALADSLKLNFVWLFTYLTMGEGRPEYDIPAEGVEYVKAFLSRHRKKGSSKCRLYTVPSLNSDHRLTLKLPDKSTTTMGKKYMKPNLDRC